MSTVSQFVDERHFFDASETSGPSGGPRSARHRDGMTVEKLMATPPALHFHEGRAMRWAVRHSLLRELDRRLPPGAHTLETGAGLSTLFFALKGTRHIAIAPDGEIFERIRRWCGENAVDIENLRLIAEPSERCLPSLQCGRLDAALIDGRHGFPAPFIDWHYIDPLLKVGGLLAVDDTQLWTGAVLRDFLREDPAWRFEVELEGKTTLFTKLAEGSSGREWVDQPWVASRSRNGRRRHGQGRLRKGMELLVTGRWKTLWEKTRSLQKKSQPNKL